LHYGSFGLSVCQPLLPHRLLTAELHLTLIAHARRGLITNNTNTFPMKGTEVSNPQRSSPCDCTCVLIRNQTLSRDSQSSNLIGWVRGY